MRIPALAFVLLAGALSASARLAKAPSSKAAAPGAAFLAARHDAPVADIQRRQDTTAGPATDTDPTTATDPTTDATDVVEEVDSVSAAPASDLPGPAADGTNVGKRQVPNADVPGVPEPNLSGVTDTVDGVLPVGAGAIGSK